jgi:hypothetical protein
MGEHQGTLKYLVDVDLGSNGGHVRARSLDELEQWVAQEREFWNWCSGTQRVTEVHDLANHVRHHLDQLTNELANLKKADPPADYKKIISLLRSIYTEGKLAHSTSLEAELIERVREQEGPVTAAAALAVSLNKPLTLQRQNPIITPEILRGAGRMILFLEGVDPKTPELISTRLQDTLHTYSEQINENRAQAEALEHRLMGLVGEQTDTREKGLAAMAMAVRLARQRARQQQAEAEDRLINLERIYNEKLSLDAPVSYWRHKCVKHRRWAMGHFVLFGALLASAVGFAYKLSRTTRLGDLNFWQSADLSAVALLTISVGIIVAVIRIPLRLAMSELHLGNDADERVTMVNTYLALRAGEHTTTEHMEVVLDRLFKPATDGIVKDDFGPVTAADALGKALQR